MHFEFFVILTCSLLLLLLLPPQHAVEKDDAAHIQDVGVEVYRVQELLARLQSRLDDHHQTKTRAEAEHRQALQQLEETKSRHSSMTSKVCEAKASGEPGRSRRACAFL